MKLIPLTQGKFAKVDDADYEMLMQRKWFASKKDSGNEPLFYACTKLNNKKVYMHRYLVETDLPHIDHKNNDPLDNQRHNLKPCTNAENISNSRLRKDNKVGVKGVYPHKGKYRSDFRRNGKLYYMGQFVTIEEARIAREEGIKEYEKNLITVTTLR
jgi:hypothetical protein